MRESENKCHYCGHEGEMSGSCFDCFLETLKPVVCENCGEGCQGDEKLYFYDGKILCSDCLYFKM